MWWLIYRRDDAVIGIAIVEAPSLYHARMRAAVAGLGKAADFSEGKEIDPAHVKRVPPELIGRLLSPEEAAELTNRLAGRDPGSVEDSPSVQPPQEAHSESVESQTRTDAGTRQEDTSGTSEVSDV